MNFLKRFLINKGVVKARPHEKAELGQGTWGRQSASSKPMPIIKAKVIRKDGIIENLGRLK